ncbi:MAG: sulfite exporter TauE/SafE family protein [Eggerthellaceae bacterium]|nr:sulfite exporter TauE/SafE family protein [Eggerthellaceae bacterium]
MDEIFLFIALAVVGLAIGVFSGMLGIGGGTIMVPVFRLLFGMSALVSTATSLFTIVPTSFSGALTRIRQKTCIISLGVAAGLGGACTSPVGVWLASISPAWLIMIVAAIVIAYSAVSMFTQALQLQKEEKAGRLGAEDGKPAHERPAGGQAGESAEGEQDIHTMEQEIASAAFKPTRKQIAIGFVIGFAAGLASGYIGVGGGFLMIPLMIHILGTTMKESSGSSLIAMIILAIPGVVSEAFLGNIDYMVGIAVAVGSIPGAIIGAHLVRRIPEGALRFTFSGFLLIAATLLILNELSHIVAF